MSKKARLILLLLLAIVLALFIFPLPIQGYSANIDLMTPQEVARSNNNAITIAVLYFILLLFNSGFYLLAKFTLNNSADLNQNFWLNFRKPKRLGKHKLKGETEPFTQIELQDVLGNRLDITVARHNGSFFFYVKPGVYILNLSKFGFQKTASDPIEISGYNLGSIKLKLKRDEMIATDSPVITFFFANQLFWAVIVLLSIICAYVAYPYLGSYKIILILLTSPICLWIFLSEQKSYLKITERSGKKIAKTYVNILNHKDEKLAEILTDKFGRIKMVASKGFYKVAVARFTPRIFHIKENREIVNFKLKV